MYEPSQNNTVIETVKKSSRRSHIARNPLELAKQAMEVADAMAQKGYKLMLFTPDDLRNKAQEYEAALLLKAGSRSQRTPLTMLLNNMQADAAQKMSKVKIALQLKYGKKDAVSYYKQFGIIQTSNSAYLLPKKYEEFVAAIKQIEEALVTHQIESQEYGLTYWKTLRNNFESELNAATSKDTISSEQVGETQRLKAELTQMLRSVTLLVQAEEPNDYERVLRNMGFRREKLS